jgi:hypothetical protein
VTDDEALAATRHHLEVAGLPATDEQVAALARGYAALRASMDSLWEVTEARGEVPALHYDPAEEEPAPPGR